MRAIMSHDGRRLLQIMSVKGSVGLKASYQPAGYNQRFGSFARNSACRARVKYRGITMQATGSDPHRQ